MDGTTRRLHILVVDDDSDAAQAMAQLLPLISRVPMVVTVAFDGKQAVALACGPPAPPDVVILDMEMPGLNGFDAAAAIQERLGERTPRLIAVSGNVKYVRIASSIGIFHHALTKPVDVEQLTRLLDGACPQG
jgi:CheY-like chemotaxis protein